MDVTNPNRLIMKITLWVLGSLFALALIILGIRKLRERRK